MKETKVNHSTAAGVSYERFFYTDLCTDGTFWATGDLDLMRQSST